MTDYEILLMLDPELPEERQNEIVSRIREPVERAAAAGTATSRGAAGGSPTRSTTSREGIYHLLTFEAEPETLDEISRVLKITDGVMRHLAVRRVKGASTRPPAAAPRRARSGGRRRVRIQRTGTRPNARALRGEGRNGQHQPRRPRRQPDEGSRAAPHAERHRRLQAPPRRQHAPEGRRHRRVGRQAELLRRHRLGQPGRELRAVPRQGPPRRHRRPARLARVGGPGRHQAPGGRDHRRQRPVPRRPRRRRGRRQPQFVPSGAHRRRTPTSAAAAATTTSRSDGAARPATAAQGPPRARRADPQAQLLLLPREGREVDYKNINQLRRYISEKGKIRSRRITGACRRHQRQVAVAVKRAREMALLPYSTG